MSIVKKNAPEFSRRRFLQIIAVCGAAGGLYAIGDKMAGTNSHIARESRAMMGTQINLIVCGPDQEQCHKALNATFDTMQRLELILSRHRPDSELNQLNRFGLIEHPSTDLYAVLDLAKKMSESTGGAFDATVSPLLSLYQNNPNPEPEKIAQALELVDYTAVSMTTEAIAFAQPGMGITLDGIGKGYIVDQGVHTLKENGFANVYVEAGGDLMVTGTKPEKSPWQIGIRNPRPEHIEKMMVMRVSSETAIATSGDYIQYFTQDMQNHHILDPRTGMSPPELASATVTAPSVAMADGLATAAMVLGPAQSLEVLQGMNGCEGMFISKDLQRYKTSGFAV